MFEALVLDIYINEVRIYTHTYIYICTSPWGPEPRGNDDCADGLMEIIAAGRSVWAAIHTRGVHYTQQQDGVSEQLIGTGRRRRDAAGTGMTGADWWWGSSCWGDAEVTEKMTDGLRLDAGSSSAQFVAAW